MAVECTASNLATLAADFTQLSPAQRESIKIYLLASIAGVEPDAEELAELAACFCGLSARQRSDIIIYLLCTISNA